LEYKPIGVETEPLIGGRVDNGRTQEPHWILPAIPQMLRLAPHPGNSGNIPVQEDGTFMATLWAERQQQNKFVIELFDLDGQKVSRQSGSHALYGWFGHYRPSPHA
jgi:hypothetical protein